MTKFFIELLDQDEHACLHSWRLRDEGEIILGRSDSCQVVLGNPFVSRVHARLERSGDDWTLVAISDKGVFLQGRPVKRADLVVGNVFRLGGAGPSLRLSKARVQETEKATMLPGQTLALHLDVDRRDREVEEVAQSDFFRRLEHRVSELRGKVSPPEARPTLTGGPGRAAEQIG